MSRTDPCRAGRRLDRSPPGCPANLAQTASGYGRGRPLYRHGRARVTPIPVLPRRSGMVQLSPDTDTSCEIRACYSHAAGYRYDDPAIQGFSPHPFFGGRAFGSGATCSSCRSQAMRFRSIPAIPPSRVRAIVPASIMPAKRRIRAIMRWRLSDGGIRAELTAGTRIGVHRYTFPRGKATHLVLDLRTSLYNYPGKIMWSSLRLRRDGTLTGMRETRGWGAGAETLFRDALLRAADGACFRQSRAGTSPYKGFQGPGSAEPTTSRESLVARSRRGSISAGLSMRPLEVRVALSGVDEAGCDREPGYRTGRLR